MPSRRRERSAAAVGRERGIDDARPQPGGREAHGARIDEIGVRFAAEPHRAHGDEVAAAIDAEQRRPERVRRAHQERGPGAAPAAHHDDAWMPQAAASATVPSEGDADADRQLPARQHGQARSRRGPTLRSRPKSSPAGAAATPPSRSTIRGRSPPQAATRPSSPTASRPRHRALVAALANACPTAALARFWTNRQGACPISVQCVVRTPHRCATGIG